MKSRGVTLVELLVISSITCIIIAVSILLLSYHTMMFQKLCKGINTNEEVNIAMDFVCNKMSVGKDITIYPNKIMIDYDYIYLKNKVLRINQDQQHIACFIDAFQVTKLDNGLYKIYLSSAEFKSNRIFYKR